MDSLVLVQHCQSHHHVNREANIWPDKANGLTDLGRQQATCIATRLKNTLADRSCVVYTSSMQRALETATIIGEAFEIAPIPTAELREHNGHFALNRTENDEPWDFDESKLADFDWKPAPEFETWRECYDRVVKQMEEIKRSIELHSLPILVLHGGSLSIAVSWWLQLALDDLPARSPFATPASSISILKRDQFNRPILDRLGDLAHLYDIGLKQWTAFHV